MDSFSSPSSSSSSPQMSTGDFMDQLKVQLAQAYAEEFLEGDRCGIYGSNCPEWIISMEACNSNGITYVPLYDTLGANAVEYIINHAEVSLAFVQENKLPAMLSCVPNCSSNLKIDLEVIEQICCLTHGKMERSGCYKNVIEYASHFAEVIAKGVLFL